MLSEHETTFQEYLCTFGFAPKLLSGSGLTPGSLDNTARGHLLNVLSFSRQIIQCDLHKMYKSSCGQRTGDKCNAEFNLLFFKPSVEHFFSGAKINLTFFNKVKEQEQSVLANLLCSKSNQQTGSRHHSAIQDIAVSINFPNVAVRKLLQKWIWRKHLLWMQTTVSLAKCSKGEPLPKTCNKKAMFFTLLDFHNQLVPSTNMALNNTRISTTWPQFTQGLRNETWCRVLFTVSKIALQRLNR